MIRPTPELECPCPRRTAGHRFDVPRRRTRNMGVPLVRWRASVTKGRLLRRRGVVRRADRDRHQSRLTLRTQDPTGRRVAASKLLRRITAGTASGRNVSGDAGASALLQDIGRPKTLAMVADISRWRGPDDADSSLVTGIEASHLRGSAASMAGQFQLWPRKDRDGPPRSAGTEGRQSGISCRRSAPRSGRTPEASSRHSLPLTLRRPARNVRAPARSGGADLSTESKSMPAPHSSIPRSTPTNGATSTRRSTESAPKTWSALRALLRRGIRCRRLPLDLR